MTDSNLRVDLVDALVPVLNPGEYTLTATQNVSTVTKTFKAEQPIEVRSPRLRLDPDWVHATFPIRNHQGTYDDVLPHITVRRAVLPWERELLDAANDERRVPWMALLLFGTGEIPGDPTCQGHTETIKVSELRNQHGPNLDPLALDEKAESCQTIVVKATLFRHLVPRRSELAHLAHRRVVEPSTQEAAALRAQFTPGEYAVVITNRFPSSAGDRYVAHLIALEGWENYLAESEPKIDANDQVRLISLWSWTFESLPDSKPGFEALTHGLANNTEMLTPPDTTTPAGKNGKLTVPLRTETGVATVGWYRGPATTTEVAQASVGAHPVESLVYLPDHGVFDVTHAAAWSLGRAQAIADPAFCQAVLRLRGRARDLLRRGFDVPTENDQKIDTAAQLRSLAAAGTHLKQRLTTQTKRTKPNSLSAATSRAAQASKLATIQPGITGEARTICRELLKPLHGNSDPGQEAADHTMVRRWLLRRWMLHEVPFEHLIPDPRMLPVESLRFWYLDPTWIENLIRGALSIGQAHALDASVDDLLFGPNELPRPDTWPRAGMLIRSALVSGWPTLGISATHNGQTVPVHRERRGPDVLLCLFFEVPDTVTLAEPHEATHFGVSRPEELQKTPLLVQARIRLREQSGELIGKDLKNLDKCLRPDGLNVLDVGALLAALKKVLRWGDVTRSPSQFALQMLLAPKDRTWITGG